MFLANTKMGKSCHLCLEHDYTITFPVCQGTCHHDRWGLFLALLFEPTGGFDEAVLKSDCPNLFWGSNNAFVLNYSYFCGIMYLQASA